MCLSSPFRMHGTIGSDQTLGFICNGLGASVRPVGVAATQDADRLGPVGTPLGWCVHEMTRDLLALRLHWVIDHVGRIRGDVALDFIVNDQALVRSYGYGARIGRVSNRPTVGTILKAGYTAVHLPSRVAGIGGARH